MVKMVKSSYAWELREGFGSSGKSRSLLQYIDFRPLCYFDFLLPDKDGLVCLKPKKVDKEDAMLNDELGIQ